MAETNETAEIFWVIEELVPAQNAIGSKDYWTILHDSYSADELYPKLTLPVLRGAGRRVRLVRVMREIVDG